MKSDNAEIIIKGLGVDYTREDNIFKIKINEKQFCIVSVFDFKWEHGDCVFTLFEMPSRELILADYGFFNKIIKGIKPLIKNT